jgi:transcriptional regulator with XRE-family HTH domain
MGSDRPFFTPEMGARLRELRRRAGLSQDEVAARMGLEGKSRKSFVSQLENARILHPYAETLVRYLRVCGALMGEFFDQFNRVAFVAVESEKVRQLLGRDEERQPAKDERQEEKVQRVLWPTEREVKKWQSRAVHPREGKPIAPDKERAAAERFRDYRLMVNVISEAVMDCLRTLPVGVYDYHKYKTLARIYLGVLRAGRKRDQERRQARAHDYVSSQGLAEKVAEQVRAIVSREFERMVRPGPTRY